MKVCEDHDFALSVPQFEKERDQLLAILMQTDPLQLQKDYRCSQKIFDEIYAVMHREYEGLPVPAGPAILSYEGIAFRYMAPAVFSEDEWAYINAHLRIVSGLYGLLRPLDAVQPYRLEMGQKKPVDLYAFWKGRIAKAIDDPVVVCLASREYAKAVAPYLPLIQVRFFEEDESGKRSEKGVYAKMARGAMIRWMAENAVENPADLAGFDQLGYVYDAAASAADCYVFARKADAHA